MKHRVRSPMSNLYSCMPLAVRTLPSAYKIPARGLYAECHLALFAGVPPFSTCQRQQRKNIYEKKKNSSANVKRPQILKIQMKAAASQLSPTGEQDLSLYRTHYLQVTNIITLGVPEILQLSAWDKRRDFGYTMRCKPTHSTLSRKRNDRNGQPAPEQPRDAEENAKEVLAGELKDACCKGGQKKKPSCFYKAFLYYHQSRAGKTSRGKIFLRKAMKK